MDTRNHSEAHTGQDWRLRWISSPILKLFKRVSPRMSQTEREALDAGTVNCSVESHAGANCVNSSCLR